MKTYGSLSSRPVPNIERGIAFLSYCIVYGIDAIHHSITYKLLIGWLAWTLTTYLLVFYFVPLKYLPTGTRMTTTQ